MKKNHRLAPAIIYKISANEIMVKVLYTLHKYIWVWLPYSRYIPDTLALVWRICTDTVMIHPQTLDWVKHDCVMITGIVQHIGPAIYVYTCYISSKWHFNGDTLSYVDRFIILVGHDDPTIRMLFGSLITRVAWVLNVASEIKTLSNIDITVVHWQLVITR